MAAKRKVRVRKSQANYRKNPESTAKKAAYDTEYHKTPERKEYRAKLAKIRRKKKVMGKGGKDVSHRASGGTTMEDSSTNRARQGSGGKKKKK